MEIHVSSFGARLRMRGEIFVLATPDLSGAGNDTTQEIAPHQVESILLYEKGGSISADAMALALRHQVDILLCDQLGMPLGRLWALDASPPLAIQTGQFRMMGTPRSMDLVKEWLSRKFRRKLAFLERLERYREGEKAQLIQTTRHTLAEYYARLQQVSTQNIGQAAASFRGIEGSAARLYFGTLSALLQPEYQFDGRSRRPAADIFNALLNYGYGMLYRTVEKALIEAGIHPYAGFHHGLAKRQKAMVFDVIEAYRPWVDHIVFVLCSRKTAGSRHVKEQGEGLWLSNEGKTLMVKAFHEFFKKAELPFGNVELPPVKILKEEMRALAAYFATLGREVESLLPNAEMPEASIYEHPRDTDAAVGLRLQNGNGIQLPLGQI
ncbi:MAG TPA: CRISPR-associated endonuclease Cas1 [Saprospiraceae bacterium]|nr:CRISPR-associated endonuclease Cas1 [Saprospiraceae bacterium]HRK83352.1 CRISPR-associated endonuclease Cas1 [Saprospiraceae bacterium]